MEFEEFKRINNNPGSDDIILYLFTKIQLLERRVGELEGNFQPPILNEVIEFFENNAYSQDAAIRAFNHYHQANWKDTKGKPVKNWKQKMRTVWFKDQNRIKTVQQTQGKTLFHDGKNFGSR